MYHIKTDKRSQTSAKLICEGLISCMKKKEFTQITITDIQRASSVGRSTFYRLFDNTSDVVAYMCDRQFGEALANVSSFKELSAEDAAKEIISSMMSKEEVITAIAKSGRMDILYSSARTNAIAMRDVITEKYGLDKFLRLTDDQIDYFVAGLLSLMFSCLAVWINHGRTETVDQVYDNMTRLNKRLDDI